MLEISKKQLFTTWLISMHIVFVICCIYNEHRIIYGGKAYLELKYPFSKVEICNPYWFFFANERIYIVDGKEVRLGHRNGIFSDDAEFDLIEEDVRFDLKKRTDFLDANPEISVYLMPLSSQNPHYLSNLYNGNPWPPTEEIYFSCKLNLELYLSDYPTIQQQMDLRELVAQALQGTYCDFNIKFLDNKGEYLLITGKAEGEKVYHSNPTKGD